MEKRKNMQLVETGVRGDKMNPTFKAITTLASSKLTNTSPYFRLDSSLIEQQILTTILKKLKEHGIELASLEELGFNVWAPPRMAMKKLRMSRTGLKTLFIGVGIAKKVSINLAKVEIGYVPNDSYLIEEGYVLIPETGEPACGYVFKGALEALHSYYEDNPPLAATHNLFRITCKSCPSELKLYIALLLNTNIGITIMRYTKYGALQPHYRGDILSKTQIPLLKGKHVELISNALSREAKAWRAYFKAMKIVEEYIGKTERLTTSIVRVKGLHNISYLRLDPSRLLAFSMVSRLVEEHEGKMHRISDMFQVYTAGIPREKKYKIKVGQYPLITIDSIDESGIIDYEKIYYITKTKGTPWTRGSLLLVKDGASIGKIGILPYDAYVMQGIATLIPKPGTKEQLKYYIFALLKTRFYKKIIESLGYGATVQYSITKDELESLEVPVVEEIVDEVSKNVKEFIGNIYEADELKRKALSELESCILKLIS